MWAAYGVLVVVAVASFALGVVPIGFIAVAILVTLVAVAGLRTASRARDRQVPRGGPAEDVPGSSEASYQPGRDPSRSGTS